MLEQLKLAGYQAISQPLFDIEKQATTTEIKQFLTEKNANSVIFISAAAVNFANKALPLKRWQQQQALNFIAVGRKTKTALLKCGITQVVSPEQENSEGLLSLAELNAVENQTIIIVRGDKGRELLANELSKRGAKVHYLASYQKVWRSLNSQKISDQWQNAQINCIVVTSIALLERMAELLNNFAHQDYWHNVGFWVVASHRIALKAQQLGIKQIIIAQGASDQAIITAISTIEHTITGTGR